MHSLQDYVRLISTSMRVPLNDADQYEIAKWLTRDEEYEVMLHKLERKILEVHKRKVENLKTRRTYKNSGLRLL